MSMSPQSSPKSGPVSPKFGPSGVYEPRPLLEEQARYNRQRLAIDEEETRDQKSERAWAQRGNSGKSSESKAMMSPRGPFRRLEQPGMSPKSGLVRDANESGIMFEEHDRNHVRGVRAEASSDPTARRFQEHVSGEKKAVRIPSHDPRAKERSLMREVEESLGMSGPHLSGSHQLSAAIVENGILAGGIVAGGCHTHAHTRTRTHTHIDTHIQIHTYTHTKHAYLQTHTHTHTQTGSTTANSAPPRASAPLFKKESMKAQRNASPAAPLVQASRAQPDQDHPQVIPVLVSMPFASNRTLNPNTRTHIPITATQIPAKTKQ